MKRRTTYWIQEQAPAGNYFDSIGFPEETSLEHAVGEFEGHVKAWPKRTCQLVRRTDVVLLPATKGGNK